MQRKHKTRWLLAISVVLIATAVWFGGKAQRSAGEKGDSKVRAAQTMLISRLDLETGLRGFILSGRESFLSPFVKGLGDYRAASRSLAAGIGSRGTEHRLLVAQNRLTKSWLRQAAVAIKLRHADQPISMAKLLQRKSEMDRFRAANASFVALAEADRRDLQDQAGWILLALIAGLVFLTAVAGYFLIERPSNRRKREIAEGAEFADTLQYAEGESEAQALLGRELNRAIASGSTVVFSRNNSENRLETVTELPDASPLAARMATAVPSDCLAIRRGRPVERVAGKEELSRCDLCAAVGANSLCVPSLVGGEVIGAVLVSRDSKPLGFRERARLESTVTTAAPVLANLRNLAIAETRAVTDSLTGLANARSAAQDLKRIVAFAGRTATPLSAVMLDLDHFKRINDNFGHQIGDEALAAVGEVLRSGTRASDFVARYGGEEFLILLQDTNAESAVELAEKLRESLRQMQVPGLAGRVTASFGVASIPEHAGDSESLIRAADRALYAAKEAGRDQVRTPASAEAEFGGSLQETGADG
jgi:diguanylate cyclase (GGDEF)-like protein